MVVQGRSADTSQSPLTTLKSTLTQWFTTKPPPPPPTLKGVPVVTARNVPVSAASIVRKNSKYQRHTSHTASAAPAQSTPAAAHTSLRTAITTLQTSSATTAAVRHACEQLKTLAAASDANKTQIVAANGIQLLVTTAQHHHLDSTILKPACAALRTICSRQPASLTAFHDAHGFAMLLDAGSTHLTDVTVMEEVTYTIYVMIQHLLSRTTFISADWSPLLHQITAVHARNSHIQWNVSKILQLVETVDGDEELTTVVQGHAVYELSFALGRGADAEAAAPPAATTAAVAPAQPAAASQQTPAATAAAVVVTDHNITSLHMKYTGQMRNGKPHGKGIAVMHNGMTTYTGEWVDGWPHGKGVITSVVVRKYEGEVFGGHMHGYGTCIYAGPQLGQIFRGTYNMNKKHGRGVMTWDAGLKHGESYEGEYVDDCQQGRGTYRWPNGNKYIGCFRFNMKHGQGVLTDIDDKVIWSGEWVDDEPHIE